MNFKVLLLALSMLMLSGCVSGIQEIEVVKSYKTVNKYKTISISQAKEHGVLSEKIMEEFENKLFDSLYAQKNANNFIPGDQLSLKYDILSVTQMYKSFTDWGTYFGKESKTFEVLFTIYDKNDEEIGLVDVDIDVEFWIFPSDSLAISSAINAATHEISKHLKANYLAK